jgi:hypothetical protein
VVIARDIAHIRAAVAFRAAHGPAEVEARMVANLGTEMAQYGHSIEYLEMSVHALPHAPDARDRMVIHTGRYMAYSTIGRATDAEREMRLAVEAGRDSSDPESLANVVQIQFPYAATEAEVEALSADLDALLPLLSEVQRIYFAAERDWYLAKLLRVVNPARAESAARRLLNSEIDMLGRMQLCRVLLDKGELSESVEVAAGMNESDPAVTPNWAIGARLVRADVWLAAGYEPAAVLELARPALDSDWAEGRFPDEAARVVSHAELRAGNSREALAVLDQALTRSADAAPWDVAKLRWRRSILLHRAGHVDEVGADLAWAITSLQGEAFSLGLKELLGAIVARAATSADSDPAQAAMLLGCVQAYRRTWTLPYDMDAVADQLTARLLPAHADTYTAGQALNPDVQQFA